MSINIETDYLSEGHQIVAYQDSRDRLWYGLSNGTFLGGSLNLEELATRSIRHVVPEGYKVLPKQIFVLPAEKIPNSIFADYSLKDQTLEINRLFKNYSGEKNI